MQNRWGWTRTALATLFAAGMFSVPQSAIAGERCDNRNYRDSGNRNVRYQDRSYQNARYRNNDYRDNRYSNSGYRDSRYRNNDGYYDDGYYRDNRSTRSAGESAAIIGGGAAAGAAVGGLSGGKKGALIGAAVGGAGGLIYDRVTRNRRRIW